MKFRYRYPKLNYYSIFFVALLAGCATGPSTSDIERARPETPINVSNLKIAPIGAGKVEMNMAPRKVGSYHSTVFPFLVAVNTADYNNARKLTPEFHSACKRMIEDTLAEAGYDVAGRDELFVESDLSRGRFLIGGEIVDVAMNSYEGVPKYRTAGNIKIEWQVYDVVKKAIIYKTTTTAENLVNNSDGIGLSFIMIDDALRNLLAKKDLVETLSEASK